MRGVVYAIIECPNCGREELKIADYWSAPGSGTHNYDEEESQIIAILHHNLLKEKFDKDPVYCRKCHSVLRLSKPDWMDKKAVRIQE
jgi:hypothetical protein